MLSDRFLMVENETFKLELKQNSESPFIREKKRERERESTFQ